MNPILGFQRMKKGALKSSNLLLMNLVMTALKIGVTMETRWSLGSREYQLLINWQRSLSAMQCYLVR
jgi:hypothetical protein